MHTIQCVGILLNRIETCIKARRIKPTKPFHKQEIEGGRDSY